MADDDVLYTTDVAAALGISIATVTRKVKAGEIPLRRRAGRHSNSALEFDRAEIEALAGRSIQVTGA